MEAYELLGDYYFWGYGDKADYVKAVEWYTKALDHGNKKVQFNLGWCYYYGKGVKTDKNKALSLMQRSAKQNYNPAIEFIQKHERK